MQTGSIQVTFESDFTIDVIGYDADSGAFYRMYSYGPVMLKDAEGTIYRGNFNNDQLSESSNVDPLALFRAIPSLVMIEVPPDDRFTRTEFEGGEVAFVGSFPAGNRALGDDVPFEDDTVTYTINADGTPKSVARGNSEQIYEFAGTYSEQLDGWLVADMHGEAKLIDARQVGLEAFTKEGVIQTLYKVRARTEEMRLAGVESGRVVPPDSGGMPLSTKIGIVAGVVVLIAIAAMIRQRTRS